jgi:hypothetical protein
MQIGKKHRETRRELNGLNSCTIPIDDCQHVIIVVDYEVVISKIGMGQRERARRLDGKTFCCFRNSLWKRIIGTSARVFSLGNCPCPVIGGAITERPSYAGDWANTKMAVCIFVDVANLIEMKG